MKIKKQCPICSSLKLKKVTKRTNITPYQNKLLNTKQEAVSIKKIPIEIVACMECGFIFNLRFDDSIELYDSQYNNDQNSSIIFKDYINDSIEYLLENYINEGSRILEIGCGKEGTYLKNILNKFNKVEGIGYDVAYRGEKELFEGKLKFYDKYYDFNKSLSKNLDFIISRHVIEHISKPNEMLQNLAKEVEYNEKLICFLETPNVEWILDNGVWYDFFYEHCSYFSPYSLKVALSKNNLAIKELKQVFNGQYMIAIVEKEKSLVNDKREVENIIAKVEKYSIHENAKITELKEYTKELSKDGKVALWGAGAKANAFLNEIDSDGKYVDSVIDINSSKVGKFIAGTGHEIISVDDILKRNIKSVIIMNNNYYKEISELIEKKNINIDLITF